MICRKCGKPIPYKANRCNHCKKKTGYRLSTSFHIQNDMFEQPSYYIPIDKEKSIARYRYLKGLNEYKKLEELTKRKPVKHFSMGKYLLKTLGVCFSIIISALLFCYLLFESENGQTAIMFLPILIGCIIIPIIFSIFEKIRGDKKPKKKIVRLEKSIKIHDAKKVYYANQNVFGYIVFDHTEKYTDRDGNINYIDFYAYYEVVKGDIISIGYDSYFAEYVLQLRNPIYMDYSLEPTSEFRVQDVFDDTVLSNALSCSLPAKNIPF